MYSQFNSSPSVINNKFSLYTNTKLQIYLYLKRQYYTFKYFQYMDMVSDNGVTWLTYIYRYIYN